ncbi:ABC transporter permease [Sphingomonas desiccabilis]|uniref:ABC transporter permease n=1 Tax=Sphingomonas desiccabilis TaxID=429134 RepID=A0A4Q2ISZ9_9SPHN|nr:ABC transporter permease [Sphingomonas desiccabilis]MBB3911803.1 sulfonate transport system permease protein [Sphingomonas desiccabilis]RXZ31478.1 ABC transporter permease [Sphingomonas desiccabilis]
MATVAAGASPKLEIAAPVLAWLASLAGPFLLLAAWQLLTATGALPDTILPPPMVVLHTFSDLWSSGELPAAIGISLVRLVQGYAIGAALGLSIGALTGISRTAEDLVMPSVRALAAVPLMAWLPLLILLVGIGEPLKLLAIAKAATLPITLSTFAAVRGMPSAWREVGAVLQLRRVTLLRRLFLPALALPLFTGLRQGLGNAWVALVGAELLASTEGLGYLMNWGRVIFQLDVVLAGILCVGVIGLLLDRGLRLTEARLSRRLGGAR